MEDGKALLGGLELFRGEDVAVLEAHVLVLVEEALPLHARHVQDVQFGHDALQIGGLRIGDALLLQDVLFDVAGQLEFLRRDEDEAHVLIAGHGLDQRMHGAAELEVAAQADGQVREAALFAPDGQKVGQRLRGVVVAAVAGVDHRHVRLHRGHQRRALLGVAHGDDVRVAGDDFHGVGNALALGGRGRGRLGKAQHLPAQFVHGRLKAEARARGGLEKQRRQLLAVAGLGVFLGVGDDVFRRGDEAGDLLRREFQNADQAPHFAPPIQLSSEGLSRKASRRAMSSSLI